MPGKNFFGADNSEARTKRLADFQPWIFWCAKNGIFHRRDISTKGREILGWFQAVHSSNSACLGTADTPSLKFGNLIADMNSIRLCGKVGKSGVKYLTLVIVFICYKKNSIILRNINRILTIHFCKGWMFAVLFRFCPY